MGFSKDPISPPSLNCSQTTLFLIPAVWHFFWEGEGLVFSTLRLVPASLSLGAARISPRTPPTSYIEQCFLVTQLYSELLREQNSTEPSTTAHKEPASRLQTGLKGEVHSTAKLRLFLRGLGKTTHSHLFWLFFSLFSRIESESLWSSQLYIPNRIFQAI